MTRLISDLAKRELEEWLADKARLDTLSIEKRSLESTVGLLEGDIQSLHGEVEIHDCELTKLCDDARFAQEAKNKAYHNVRCLESK